MPRNTLRKLISFLSILIFPFCQCRGQKKAQPSGRYRLTSRQSPESCAILGRVGSPSWRLVAGYSAPARFPTGLYKTKIPYLRVHPPHAPRGFAQNLVLRGPKALCVGGRNVVVLRQQQPAPFPLRDHRLALLEDGRDLVGGKAPVVTRLPPRSSAAAIRAGSSVAAHDAALMEEHPGAAAQQREEVKAPAAGAHHAAHELRHHLAKSQAGEVGLHGFDEVRKGELAGLNELDDGVLHPF